MLDRRVLLSSFGITAIEKANDVGNCHAAVERLPADVDVERALLAELTRIIVKQLAQLRV